MKTRATHMRMGGGRVLPIATAVAMIFAGAAAQGSQMFRYDVSNTAYLSSDQYNLTPITALEQPVGLMLDGANEVRGPNIAPLLTAAIWSAGSATQVTFADNVMEFPVPEVGGKSVPNGLIYGRLYWAEVEVIERTAGAVYFPYDGVGTNRKFTSSTGKFSHVFRASSTSLFVYSDNFVGKIRNVKVHEIAFTNLWSDAATTFVGGASKVYPNVYRVNTSDGSLAAVDSSALLTIGKWYEVIMFVDSMTVPGNGLAFMQGATTVANIPSLGFRRFVFNATSTVFRIQRSAGATDIIFSGVSVRELKGNHLHQPTSTARPVLSAKLNLLSSTEFPGGLTDASPRSAFGLSVTSMAPYANAIVMARDAGGTVFAYRPITPAPSTVYTFSTFVRFYDGGAPVVGGDATVRSFNINIGGRLVPDGAYMSEDLGGGLYRVSGTTDTPSSVQTYCGVAIQTNAPNRPFKVSGYQLVLGTVPAKYQRVNASVTDYDAVGFPMYLRFDGVDDCLFTPVTVDFSGTDKVTVVAGIQKNSDAAAAPVVELSAVTGSNDGSFALFAPASAASNVQFQARGTTSGSATVSTGVVAPFKGVLGGSADIVASSTVVRINSARSASPGSLGTGNFAAHQMYVGRRNNATLPWNGQLYTLHGTGRLESPDAFRVLETYAKGAMT